MPTELETMKHAKEYIDKLANGIDPFTDKPVRLMIILQRKLSMI